MSIKRKTLASKQRTALVLIAVLIVVLSLAWLLVNYLVSIDTFKDIDGTVYKIKRNGDSYAMYDESGKALDTVTEINQTFFVTKRDTLVKINKDGSAQIYSPVDTSDGENLSEYGAVRMYNYIKSTDDLQRIQITKHAENGDMTFTFERDSSDNYLKIRGHENVAYDSELFAQLSHACRSPYYIKKITPDVVEKYGYEEYGLDSPQYTVRVTANNGVSHTIAVGKKTVMGNGYYVRLLDTNNNGEYTRKSVYVMADFQDEASGMMLAECFTLPVETYVTPVLNYNLTTSNYVFVYDFKVTDYNYYADGTQSSKLLTALSFWDLEERRNTEFLTQSYYVIDDELDAYAPASDAVYKVMGGFIEMEFVGVKKLGATADIRAQYGLDKPTMEISYRCQRSDSNGNVYYFRHYISFSEATENNTHYAVADVYYSTSPDGDYQKLSNFDFIVEIDRSWLDYLSWDRLDWTESDYFQIDIGIIDYLEFELPDGSCYRFELDMLDENTIEGAYAIKGGVRHRISTQNFQTLYMNLVYNKLFGSAELSEEEEAAIINDPGRFRLTWRFGTDNGYERTHSYYLYQSNKDYITVDGDGGFYVISSAIEKLAKDAVSVFNGVKITADSQYTKIDE